jgi:superfamily II DNA or RNA helicase
MQKSYCIDSDFDEKYEDNTKDIEDISYICSDSEDQYPVKKRKLISDGNPKKPKKSKITWTVAYKKPSQNNFVYGLYNEHKDSNIKDGGQIDTDPTPTILKHWYSVSKSTLSETEIKNIEKELLVSSTIKDYITKEEMPPVSMFHQNETYIFVPPSYGINRWGNPQHDLRRSGNELQHKFSDKYSMKKELRQDEAYDILMARMTGVYGSGYLSLPPGGGKTVVALKVGSDLGRVIGVVVTKEFLTNQWRERIIQYIPGAKIGIVQGSNIDVEGCDVILFMLQTILYHMEDPVMHNLLGKCGTIIIDESRHIGASEFCKIFPLLTAKHILALDGTPRTDGMDMILEHWIGPVTFKTKREYNFKVRVKVLDIPYEHPKERFMINKDYNRGRMITELSKVEERNNGLSSELSLYVNTGLQTLILSERTEHLKLLEKQLLGLKPDASTGQFESGISKHPEKMKELESKQFIFATFAMAQEALDIPTLRILMYAIPKPNPAQSSARIMRGTSSHEPLILDPYDKWSFWASYYDARHQFFRNEGFEIEYPTRELAEENMVRGVELIERDGKFILKKNIDKKRKAQRDLNQDKNERDTQRDNSQRTKKRTYRGDDHKYKQPIKKQKSRCPF